MLDYLLISQALPTDSLLHRLDPRTRLLGFLVLVGVLIGLGRLSAALIVLAAVAALVLLARVPPRLALQGVRLLLPWLLLIVLIQLLFGVGNEPACPSFLNVGVVDLTWCTLRSGIITLLRFIGLVLLVSLFLWTMPIPSLVRALEGLARPFTRIGLPVHGLVLSAVITVRFLPTLALDLERLQKAQLARGAGLGHGRGGFVQRVRRTLPLIVPLFVLALERAERLAEAMEARAYSGGRGRGQRESARLVLRTADWLALGMLASFTLLALRI